MGENYSLSGSCPTCGRCDEIERLQSWQRARLEQHDQMNAEIERLRAALQYYADESTYVVTWTEGVSWSPIHDDVGEKARGALGDEQLTEKQTDG